MRWQTYNRSTAGNPDAFLATTTTRLAINALQSARVRRETYIGPWLPEPVDTSADPHLGAERGDALEIAALLLMEKLTRGAQRSRGRRDGGPGSPPAWTSCLDIG